jgi:dihydroneopterin aldolase
MRISLSQLEFQGFHGLYEAEKKSRQSVYG